MQIGSKGLVAPSDPPGTWNEDPYITVEKGYLWVFSSSPTWTPLDLKPHSGPVSQGSPRAGLRFPPAVSTWTVPAPGPSGSPQLRTEAGGPGDRTLPHL